MEIKDKNKVRKYPYQCLEVLILLHISDAVIALERDQQAEDPTLANTTTVRVLKNRYAGETGVASYLLYDKDSGRLKEIENPLESDNQSDVEDFL